jgi:hypothetical protein
METALGDLLEPAAFAWCIRISGRAFPSESCSLEQDDYAEIMRIPDRGCEDVLTESSVVSRASGDRYGSGADAVGRQAVRLVPWDVRADHRVVPKAAPNLNEGLADILDWYIQMAGTVGTSRSPSKA